MKQNVNIQNDFHDGFHIRDDALHLIAGKFKRELFTCGNYQLIIFTVHCMLAANSYQVFACSPQTAQNFVEVLLARVKK